MQLDVHGAFFVVAGQFFLRAFAKGAGVVTDELRHVSAWLTAEGYPTKAKELKNAKRALMVDGVVPDFCDKSCY